MLPFFFTLNFDLACYIHLPSNPRLKLGQDVCHFSVPRISHGCRILPSPQPKTNVQREVKFCTIFQDCLQRHKDNQ